MNKTISVTAACANGHKQTVQVYGMAMEWAKAWAALMDGSSSFYVASPRGTDSMIGKCGICGTQIDCTVEEVSGDECAPSAPPPVDRSAQVLTDGSPVPEDRSHTELRSDGQQKGYVVLSAEERARGFVRPYRDAYKHLKCGKITTMGRALSETYARDPGFYSGTFCVTCRGHFPVGDAGEFVWYEMDGSIGPKVGT
jgi:hypothetical protein